MSTFPSFHPKDGGPVSGASHHAEGLTDTPTSRSIDTVEVSAPDTIVLIHGLWMTPRSWERWIERYDRVVPASVAPNAVIDQGAQRVFGWSRNRPIRALQ